MNVIENLMQTFKRGNALTKLIYINIGVFLLLKLVDIVLVLFNFSNISLFTYLAVPADLIQLIHRGWTPLTYMFVHNDILHIFFNLLCLFWFGKLFLMYFSEKQLVGLYVFGGFVAAIFYVAAYNIFPYYQSAIPTNILIGASGSIMAIIVATAIQSPDMEMRLLLIGAVKLKYIALAAVLTSFFGITSSNAGGQLAHLGGALCGYFFIVSLRGGGYFSKMIGAVSNFIANLFGPRKLKIKPNPHKNKAPMTDAEFNMNKAKKMAEIDRILDKIKKSGYDSLSTDEKTRLFDQTKN